MCTFAEPRGVRRTLRRVGRTRSQVLLLGSVNPLGFGYLRLAFCGFNKLRLTIGAVLRENNCPTPTAQMMFHTALAELQPTTCHSAYRLCLLLLPVVVKGHSEWRESLRQLMYHYIKICSVAPSITLYAPTESSLYTVLVGFPLWCGGGWLPVQGTCLQQNRICAWAKLDFQN